MQSSRLLGRVLLTALAGLLSTGMAASAAAQQPATPEARPEDVASTDAIIAAVYESISGPAGPRDWDRFRSLFVPGARLIPTGRTAAGEARIQVWTPDEYAERAGPLFDETPFYEVEAARIVEEFGSIAHVFSTYESRRNPADAPFQRGINSFQLFNDGTRWWIVTIFWDAERDGNPIPAKYLGG